MYSGGAPLCGTCFYKRSVGPAEEAEAVPQDVWRRLTDAIAALETVVAKIDGEIEELAKSRKG